MDIENYRTAIIDDLQHSGATKEVIDEIKQIFSRDDKIENEHPSSITLRGVALGEYEPTKKYEEHLKICEPCQRIIKFYNERKKEGMEHY